MNMNNNPWVIQALVEYERDRILRDMEQIRLEEGAIQAGRLVKDTAKIRLSPARLRMLIVPTFVKWMFAWAGKFIDTLSKSKSKYRASG